MAFADSVVCHPLLRGTDDGRLVISSSGFRRASMPISSPTASCRGGSSALSDTAGYTGGGQAFLMVFFLSGFSGFWLIGWVSWVIWMPLVAVDLGEDVAAIWEWSRRAS